MKSVNWNEGLNNLFQVKDVNPDSLGPDFKTLPQTYDEVLNDSFLD